MYKLEKRDIFHKMTTENKKPITMPSTQKCIKATSSSTTKKFTTVPSSRNKNIKQILGKADAVCFDVDSTICVDEAIDELAHHLGVGTQVADLTRRAMNSGKVEFYDSLTARLNVMRPSKQSLDTFVKRHPPRLTPGVMELVQELHNRGTDVYIITGGFFSIVKEVAKELGVPTSNIFANKLMFYHDGKYAGFDSNQPTCRSGGKARAIQSIKDKHHYKNLIMIGDGATDLEASPPADAFIGFGGNQVRTQVQEEAEYYVHSFRELITVLQAGA